MYFIKKNLGYKKNVAMEIKWKIISENQDISSLFLYPIVLKLFMKYNPSLATSTPVERFFFFQMV